MQQCSSNGSRCWCSCVASLAIGNITAIAQTNLKRMLAYSTISHMGSCCSASSVHARGIRGSDVLHCHYVLMALGTFGMILLLSRQGFEAENLEDSRGSTSATPGTPSS